MAALPRALCRWLARHQPTNEPLRIVSANKVPLIKFTACLAQHVRTPANILFI